MKELPEAVKLITLGQREELMALPSGVLSVLSKFWLVHGKKGLFIMKNTCTENAKPAKGEIIAKTVHSPAHHVRLVKYGVVERLLRRALQ
jgi:hypothetical protein